MNCIVKRQMIISFFFLLFPVSIHTAFAESILTAASCSVADIQDRITAASAGDIIKVPAGTCDWSTTLYLNKSVTLIGAGTGTSTGTNIRQTAVSGCINIAAGLGNWRISGFSFLTGAPADSRGNFNVIIATAGSYSSVRTNWRIDHNKFTGYHFAIYMMGTFSSTSVSSVVDNNEFYGGGIQFFGPGNAAWSEPTSLGSQHFLFIEDNKFHTLGSLQTVLHMIATNNAPRVVVRYNENYIDDTGPYKGNFGDFFDAHGNCHGSNIRGVRAYEIYNNKYIILQSPFPYLSEGVYLRAGTGVVWGNVFPSVNIRGGAIALYETRAAIDGDTALSSACPAACSLTAKCQSNYYRLKVASNPYTLFTNGQVVTGATSGASGTVLNVTNSGGYYIYFLTITNGPFQNAEDLVVSGTAIMKSAASSEIQNGEGYPCCDQVGRGQNNTSEPAYFWENIDEKGNPAVVYTNEPDFFVKDRDYIEAKLTYTPYQYPHPLTKPSPPRALKISN